MHACTHASSKFRFLTRFSQATQAVLMSSRMAAEAAKFAIVRCFGHQSSTQARFEVKPLSRPLFWVVNMSLTPTSGTIENGEWGERNERKARVYESMSLWPHIVPPHTAQSCQAVPSHQRRFSDVDAFAIPLFLLTLLSIATTAEDKERYLISLDRHHGP